MKSKPLWCLEDGMIFYSQGEAARYYKTDVSNISKHMRGITHSVRGVTLEYISREEAVKLGLDVVSLGQPVKIVCLTDGRVWDSIRSAAKHYGIDQSLLNRHVNGRYKQVGGRSFAKLQ